MNFRGRAAVELVGHASHLWSTISGRVVEARPELSQRLENVTRAEEHWQELLVQFCESPKRKEVNRFAHALSVRLLRQDVDELASCFRSVSQMLARKSDCVGDIGNSGLANCDRAADQVSAYQAVCWMSMEVLRHYRDELVTRSAAVELDKLLMTPKAKQLLRFLCEGERNVTEISDHLQSSVSSVSHRLKKMRFAGLVVSSRQGKLQYYSLTSLGKSCAERVLAVSPLVHSTESEPGSSARLLSEVISGPSSHEVTSAVRPVDDAKENPEGGTRITPLMAVTKSAAMVPVDYGQPVGVPLPSERKKNQWADLSTWLRKSSSFSIDQSARLIANLAHALDFIHRQGAIHRDLKPTNVLLDTAGSSQLANLGLKFGQVGGPATIEDFDLGTSAYMSPEQLLHGREMVGRAADQWSLGVIFYEMLVGMRPFQGDREQLFEAIEHADPCLPNSSGPRCLRI